MGKSRRAAVSSRRASKNASKAASSSSQAGDGKTPASGAAAPIRNGDPLREAAARRASASAGAADAPPMQNIGLLTNGAGDGQVLQIALRPALLAGVAACALTLAAAPPALAQTATPLGLCKVFGTGTVDCSGDSINGNLSRGVSITTTNKPVNNAIITDPRAAITPSSGTDGVFFSNAFGGNSTLKVDVDGAGGNGFDITTNNAHGVNGVMSANGNLTINTYGDILVSTGESNFAITGRQTADGNLSITSEGAVQSNQFGGIYAYSKYGEASVDSDGTVTAGRDGIHAKSGGGLAKVISRQNITALTGIRASSDAELSPPADPPADPPEDRTVVSVRSTGDITVAGATQSIAGFGVNAQSQYSGDVYIYSKGDIKSDAGNNYAADGIYARAGSRQENGVTVVGDIEILSYGDIDVTRNGIDAETSVPSGRTPIRGTGGGLSGDIDITSEGDVSVDTGDGIRAYAQGGAVTITSTGDVASEKGDAIWAKSNSSGGGVTIKSIGDLTTSDGGLLPAGGRAIYVYAYSADIDSNGALTVDSTAIEVNTYEDVKIVSKGSITAGDSGIDAYGETGNVYVYSDVSVDANGVLEAGGESDFGIRAVSDSGQEVYVKSIGPVSAAVSDSIGIYAALKSSGDGDDVVKVVNRGAVTAGGTAISARVLDGDGDVFVDSEGDVAGALGFAEGGAGGHGIRATAVDGDVSVISDGDVSSVNRYAIFAYSKTGASSVESTGDVYSRSDYAIFAYSGSGGTSVESTGNVVSRDSDAFSVSSSGGHADVRSIGDVTAYGAAIDVDGESVTVYAKGVITTSSTRVVSHGVTARSKAGDIDVDFIGTIAAEGGESTVGIEAQSTGGGDVDVYSKGAVFGNQAGISSSAASYGAVVIRSIGDVSGDVYGIVASAFYGDITITSEGRVSGGAVAIDAYNYGIEGSSKVVVNSTGDLTDTYAGISARSYNSAVSVISEGAIQASGDGGDGIFAYSRFGAVFVDSDGSITASGVRGVGITAYAYYNDAEVVSTGDITAGEAGIVVKSQGGGGEISVASNGAIIVSGDGGYGIFAGSINSVTVNSTGAITANGASSLGINAYSTNGDVNIDSNGAVSAGETGVSGNAGTENSGDLTIDSIGDVAGAAGYGIRAKARNGDVTVTSDGDVTGAKAAIFAYAAYNDGESGDYDYSDLYAATTGGDLTIPTVTTAEINASPENGEGESGDITIVSNGDLTATGEDGDAVRVVSGFDDSSNLVTISAGSAVTGGSGAGAVAGAGVSFTGGGTNRLENSGTITALSGVAIEGGDGAEEIVNTGTLIGSVTLGAGNDRVEISGPSDISGATFDGAAGDDTFRLALDSDGAFAGGSVSNFEVFEKTGSGTWSFAGDHAFATSVSLAGGVLDLQGTLESLVVTNSGGSLAVGGVGAVGAGTIDGDYVQEAGGDLSVDLDFASGESDLLTISGSASLAGTVTPRGLNVSSDNLKFTILTADGGVTDNGLTLNDFSSPVIGATLLFPNASDVVISVGVGFAPPDVALTGDQTALAGNLEAVFAGGGSDGALGEVFDALIFNTDGDAEYIAALNQLSPEPLLNTQTASLYAAGAFSNGLFSCADKTDARTVSREGECLWMRIDGGVLDVDSDGGTIGFEEETAGVSIGWQVEVVDNWQVGIGGGFEKATINTDTGARSEGDRYMGGISVKHQRGPLRLAAALSGGFADYETTRSISFGGFSDTVRSTQDVAHAAAELRAAYRLDFDRWYAQPFVDGAATWVDIGDATESGGAAALAIEGRDQTFLSVTPGVELGAEFALNDSFALKPFLRAGASFVDNPELVLNAGFIEAPAGAGAFVESAAIDDLYADVKAGVTLFSIKGGGSESGGRFGELGGRAAISLVYEGRHGENTRQNSAFIKMAFPF